MPSELSEQTKPIIDLVKAYGLKVIQEDGVEADDIMAYISTTLLKEDEQAVIMSTDKDFLQLVNDTTIVWSPTKKKMYNTKMVKEVKVEKENHLKLISF